MDPCYSCITYPQWHKDNNRRIHRWYGSKRGWEERKKKKEKKKKRGRSALKLCLPGVEPGHKRRTNGLTDARIHKHMGVTVPGLEAGIPGGFRSMSAFIFSLSSISRSSRSLISRSLASLSRLSRSSSSSNLHSHTHNSSVGGNRHNLKWCDFCQMVLRKGCVLCVSMRLCVCVCVCVCVRERERERETERQRDRQTDRETDRDKQTRQERQTERRDKEKQRQRDSDWERWRESHTHTEREKPETERRQWLCKSERVQLRKIKARYAETWGKWDKTWNTNKYSKHTTTKDNLPTSLWTLEGT